MISVTAIRNRGSSDVWLTSMAARIAWVWWRIAASVRVAYLRSHTAEIGVASKDSRKEEDIGGAPKDSSS